MGEQQGLRKGGRVGRECGKSKSKLEGRDCRSHLSICSNITGVHSSSYTAVNLRASSPLVCSLAYMSSLFHVTSTNADTMA